MLMNQLIRIRQKYFNVKQRSFLIHILFYFINLIVLVTIFHTLKFLLFINF